MLALQYSKPSHSLNRYFRQNTSKDTLQRESLLLKNLLADDIEKRLPPLPLAEARLRRLDSTFPLIKKLMDGVSNRAALESIEEAGYSHLIKAIQKTICETMNYIMERSQGSKKGVMYESEYHKNFYREMSYLEYYTLRSNTFQYEQNPVFSFEGQSNHFFIKEGVLPSDGILYFLEGPTRADCGSTVEVVYFKAMLDLLGKDKFNAIFSIPQGKLNIRSYLCHDPESALHPFIKFVDPRLYTEACPEKLKLGDHVVVTGAPNYLSKRPFGNFQNLHGIVVGDKNNEPLIGALELKSAKTINEISQLLLDDYNAPQTEEEKAWLNLRGIKCETPIYTMTKMRLMKRGTIFNENSCRLSSTAINNLLMMDGSHDLSELVSTGKIYNWLDQLLYLERLKKE